MADITYKTQDRDHFEHSIYYGEDVNNYVFNFVGAGDFDGQTIEGMSYPVQFDSVKTDFKANIEVEQELHFFGCGTTDFIIEPQITCANGRNFVDSNHGVNIPSICFDGPCYFPAVEINVTVQVKLKSLDQPIILSRTYLPDYQYLEISKDKAKVLEVIDRIFAKKNLSPKTAGHTQSYDFQAARINKCFKLLFGYSR